MPTYDYRCEACGHELELFQKISESPKRKCPRCKKQKLKRMIGGGAGFLFKGSGFYLTDYRSESYKQGAKADAPAPAGESSATSKGGGESPAAGKKTDKPAATDRSGPSAGKDRKKDAARSKKDKGSAA